MIKTPLFTSHDAIMYREDEHSIGGHENISDVSMELVRRRNLSALRTQTSEDKNDIDEDRTNTSLTTHLGWSPQSTAQSESLDYEVIDSSKQTMYGDGVTI